MQLLGSTESDYVESGNYSGSMTLNFEVLSLFTAIVVLLAFLSIPPPTSSHVLAQIPPSFSSGPSDFRIGFMPQESAYPVQNSTSANITQLATVLPVANKPITPASFTPVSEETEESDSASTENDDDETASSSSDNDNDSDNSDDSDDSSNDNSDDSDDSTNDGGDDEDEDDDDDGDGGGAFAFAGDGGAFAFAG
jgi:type IV secretory pathway VirB10-like protein